VETFANKPEASSKKRCEVGHLFSSFSSADFAEVLFVKGNQYLTKCIPWLAVFSDDKARDSGLPTTTGRCNLYLSKPAQNKVVDDVFPVHGRIINEVLIFE
jgi:hypothetical protein